MCGIAGIIHLDNRPVKEAEVRSMTDLLAHRGPDDHGVYVNGKVGLGHQRLSIIDLSAAGHQPMRSANGRYTLVYNGEVYNYIELRDELEQHVTFQTDTDTEVLLQAYVHWGGACLDRLNGMFAFAVWDETEKTLFAARDRFGIKPFYYIQTDDAFAFASEIPALLATGLTPREANDQAVFDYLVFNRTDHTQHTFFKGVRSLRHGQYLTVRDRQVQAKTWYDVRDQLGHPFADPTEYRELLSSAVGLRLRSDVPVGACLSGGLDSSSIVSLMLKDHGRDDVNTFSTVWKAQDEADESRFIDLYRGTVRNMYKTHPTIPSRLARLEEFVDAQGEPVPTPSPFFAQFSVMELAKQHVTVLLDGQGADEQLAGYHYFFGHYFKQLLGQGRLANLASESVGYVGHHRSVYGLKALAFYLMPDRLKLSLRIGGGISSEYAERWQDSSAVPKLLYQADTLQDALISHVDHKLEHLLKWEDRNSMWFSLESRVPFLDHRLVERTLALPGEQLLHKGMTKHILREAMRGYLPEAIRLRRDKMGFGTPADRWFREAPFRAYIESIITSDSFKGRVYWDHQEVESIFEDHMEGKVNASNSIWKWIHLEMWLRRFIDSDAGIYLGTRNIKAPATSELTAS